MKTIEVENMQAAELKERQGELAKAIDGEPDLPERYIQARLDAKIRDEKLAEQARTLEALETGLEAAKRDIEAARELVALREEERDLSDGISERLSVDLKAEREEYKAARKKLQSEHEVVNAAARGSQQIADKQIADLTARCDRLKTQATKAVQALTVVQTATAGALSGVQLAVNDVLAGIELEKADKGE